MFDALKESRDHELQRIVTGMESAEFWQECKRFLVDRGYIKPQNLMHLKEDTFSLINLYRLHACHYVTSQILALQIKAKSKDKAFADPEAGQQSEEGSDYKDEDFQDLMSKKQIERNIQEIYNRLKELINPIDEERLKLDSVHQVKSVVRTFYQKKNLLCAKLLDELDRMTAERPNLTELKKDFVSAPEIPRQQIRDRMQEVRMNATLTRLHDFKHAAQRSVWYFKVLQRMLHEHIDKKPLTMFMIGK